jgi:hypothetical protein
LFIEPVGCLWWEGENNLFIATKVDVFGLTFPRGRIYKNQFLLFPFIIKKLSNDKRSVHLILILTESRSIGPKTVLFDVPVRNLAWWGLVSGREWSGAVAEP